MSFGAHKDNNNRLVLVGPNHQIHYDFFLNRYEHLTYISLGKTKTLCVAYAFTHIEIDQIGILWGACIMDHREGSPPKKQLRHTATQRIKKCPAHAYKSLDEFGMTLNSGKAHARKELFRKLVREYGVSGARISKF